MHMHVMCVFVYGFFFWLGPVYACTYKICHFWISYSFSFLSLSETKIFGIRIDQTYKVWMKKTDLRRNREKNKDTSKKNTEWEKEKKKKKKNSKLTGMNKILSKIACNEIDILLSLRSIATTLLWRNRYTPSQIKFIIVSNFRGEWIQIFTAWKKN